MSESYKNLAIIEYVMATSEVYTYEKVIKLIYKHLEDYNGNASELKLIGRIIEDLGEQHTNAEEYQCKASEVFTNEGHIPILNRKNSTIQTDQS